MNTENKNDETTISSKIGKYTEDKATHLGESLEAANEKAATFKDKVEAGYVEKVSPAIDSAQVELASASRYLQESSIDDYLRDLESFARKHPRITAGLGILIGWKLGRALKITK